MNNANLINTGEKIPDEFYIFINTDNPIVKHNIEIGRCISSAAFSQLSMGNDKFTKDYLIGNLDYLPFVPNPNAENRIISFFNNSATADYRVEYNCELYRRLHYPLYPSRLSACYAFGDFESCRSAHQNHNWDINTVRKFRLEPSPSNRVAKVNMEIISLARYAYHISSSDQETQNAIWNQYWTGGDELELELPTINGRKTVASGTLWEYLIEGELKWID